MYIIKPSSCVKIPFVEFLLKMGFCCEEHSVLLLCKMMIAMKSCRIPPQLFLNTQFYCVVIHSDNKDS